MKAPILATLALATCALGQAPAQAGILSGYGEIHTGAGAGDGLSGSRASNAFHKGAGRMVYGAIVGVEIVFVDVWVEHNQYLDGGDLNGTWTQFLTGFDTQFDLSERTRGDTKESAYAPVFGEVGFGVGFGVGTGQQVMLPLDDSEVTDKGFLAQAQFGLGYRFTKFLSLGVSFPMQASYLFKSGNGVAANDTDTHYQSVQGAALLNLRVQIDLK